MLFWSAPSITITGATNVSPVTDNPMSTRSGALPPNARDDLMETRICAQCPRRCLHQQMRSRRLDPCTPQLLEPAGGIGHVDGCLQNGECRAQHLKAVPQPSLGVIEGLFGGKAIVHEPPLPGF